jgi:hypothetical protein
MFSMTKKCCWLFSIGCMVLMLTGKSDGAVPDETGPGTPYSPFPTDKVVVTKVKHFTVACWKIAAAGGTLYFESGKDAGGATGYSSLFDKDGNDWVGADYNRKNCNTVPGCWNHQTRGFPKFVKDYGEYETPTKPTGAQTKWVDETGKEVTFTDTLKGDHLIMRSFIEGKIEFEYHFFVSHVAIKPITVSVKYAFHFQGLIGGEPDANDCYYVKDGKKRELTGSSGLPAEFTGKQWPSPFFYMVDNNEKKTQVFYMGAKNLPKDHIDECWQAGCPTIAKDIAIFSFGRNPAGTVYTLSGLEPVFIFGFLPKADGHEKISASIESALADPFKASTSALLNKSTMVPVNKLATTVSRIQNQDKVLILKNDPSSGYSVYGLDGRAFKTQVQLTPRGPVLVK